MMVMSASRLPLSSSPYGTSSNVSGVTFCHTSKARRMALRVSGSPTFGVTFLML